MPWYFAKQGSAGFETVGPIAEREFVSDVREGKHGPSTLVREAERTRGQWVELRTVEFLKPAIEEQARLAAEREFLAAAHSPPSPPNTAPSPPASRPIDQPQDATDSVWLPKYATLLWTAGIVVAAVQVLWIAATALLTASRTENFPIGATIGSVGQIVVSLVVWRMAIEALVLLFNIKTSLDRQERRSRP